MFVPEYPQCLMKIGEGDADASIEATRWTFTAPIAQ
jgi:hypothetical protein